jgi:hypothetical protein
MNPFRWLRLVLRRWLIQRDHDNPALPDKIPPSLAPFQVGEKIPVKGTWLTVAKVIGGDVPCMIVVPSGVTRGAKLAALRDIRDYGRAEIKRRKFVAGELRKEVH